MKIWATAALFVFLQTPAPQQVRKGRIEGYVVRAVTSEPVEKARISIRRTSEAANAPSPPQERPDNFPAIPQTIMTDSQGRFIIENLEPGSYVLYAAKNGFARQEYGERPPGRPGTVLRVSADQVLKDVVFRLIPTGAVSGRVTDSSGEPVPGILVQLLQSRYDERGRRTFQAVSSARANERGEYRMYLITPGRFFVRAAPAGPSPDPSAMAMNEVAEPGFVLTYYPGTSDAATASSIEIQGGQEQSTIDFRLVPQQLFRIRGRVLDARTGRSPREVQLQIQPRSPSSPLVHSPIAYNGTNATFEVRDVAPGSYTIEAQLIPEDLDQLSIGDLLKNVAQVPVEVSNADVENVVVAFTPGFSLAGRIEIENSASSAAREATAMMVYLAPQESTFLPSLPQKPQPDGTFTIENVQPGDYRIQVEGSPNWYIKSAHLGRADVLSGFRISGPLSEALEIVLSTAAGEMEGTVIDNDRKSMPGVQVVLIPDRQRERRDLYRTATTDQNGHFTLRTIVPGDYKLFAWDVLEPFEYMDPDFLRKYEERGTSIAVSESTKLTVEARVIEVRR